MGTSTLSTRQRFRARRPLPAVVLNRNPSEEETNLTTQEDTAETPTPLRNKPLFDTANRRVPLNRFRGRQQIKVQEVVELQPEPVQEEEDEQSRRPGGLLTRITAKRPVFKR